MKIIPRVKIVRDFLIVQEQEIAGGCYDIQTNTIYLEKAKTSFMFIAFLHELVHHMIEVFYGNHKLQTWFETFTFSLWLFLAIRFDSLRPFLLESNPNRKDVVLEELDKFSQFSSLNELFDEGAKWEREIKWNDYNHDSTSYIRFPQNRLEKEENENT